MKNKTFYFLIALFFITTCAVLAQDFPRVGPRAIGMGGAFVAVSNDDTAISWNPAALFQNQESGGSGMLGFGVDDRQDFIKSVEKLADVTLDLDNPSLFASNAVTVLNAIRSLLTKNSGATGNIGYGFYTVRGGIGFTYTDQYWETGYPVLDINHLNLDPLAPDSIAHNDSSLSFQALRTKEIILTLSHTLGDPRLLVGANLKYMRGNSYFSSVSIYNIEDFSAKEFLDEAKKNKSGTASSFSMDVGAIYIPHPRFRVGITGRNIFDPEFDFGDRGKLKAGRNWRAGLAVFATSTLTIAADFDVATNKTGIGTLEDRELAVGMEKWNKGRTFAFRGGFTKNIEEKNSDYQLSGGLGFQANKMRGDVGVGFAPGSKDIYAAFSLGVAYPLTQKR